jgi:hypothetical protein
MNHHDKRGPGLLRQRSEKVLQRLHAACGGTDADHDRFGWGRTNFPRFSVTRWHDAFALSRGFLR